MSDLGVDRVLAGMRGWVQPSAKRWLGKDHDEWLQAMDGLLSASESEKVLRKDLEVIAPQDPAYWLYEGVVHGPVRPVQHERVYKLKAWYFHHQYAINKHGLGDAEERWAEALGVRL